MFPFRLMVIDSITFTYIFFIGMCRFFSYFLQGSADFVSSVGFISLNLVQESKPYKKVRWFTSWFTKKRWNKKKYGFFWVHTTTIIMLTMEVYQNLRKIVYCLQISFLFYYYMFLFRLMVMNAIVFSYNF